MHRRWADLRPAGSLSDDQGDGDRRRSVRGAGRREGVGPDRRLWRANPDELMDKQQFRFGHDKQQEAVRCGVSDRVRITEPYGNACGEYADGVQSSNSTTRLQWIYVRCKFYRDLRFKSWRDSGLCRAEKEIFQIDKKAATYTYIKGCLIYSL